MMMPGEAVALLKRTYDRVRTRLEQVDMAALWPGFRLYPFALYDAQYACVAGNNLPRPEAFCGNTAIPWQGGKPPMSIIFAGFTNHVIWLCLFAFLVGAVMQLVGLDKRIALGILARLKASSVGRVIWGMFFVNIVLGFLVPAANARAATLLPVVQGICRLLGDTPE